jgi:hypothetical protein
MTGTLATIPAELPDHICGVPNCMRPKADRRPICSPHWAMVPYSMQQAWWRQYRGHDQPTLDFIRSAVIQYGVDGGPA